ncbi:hypothetical protein [Haloferula sp. BvORR071]|uniref:hypothetical protein n=1 Tax=Haloferula sp. BvORR071 TaxID=1396141 RepID=UPI000555C5E4|nr:hypothetical protein [Haloferula sp. BvORR071]
MKPIFSTALFLAVLLLASVSAAERAIEIRCALGGDDAQAAALAAKLPREYYVHDPAGKRKLGRIMLRSLGLDLRAESFVAADGALVVTSDPDPASVKNPQQVVGGFDVPAGSQKLILLVIPRGPTVIGSQTFALDEGPQTFPVGSFKEVNLSPEPVRWVTTGQKTELPPGRALTMIPVPPANAGGLGSVMCYRRNKQSWFPFYTGMWQIAPNLRGIQVVYALAGKPDLKVVGFVE